MRVDELQRELRAMSGEQRVPGGDASAVIARGKRRLFRRRLGAGIAVLAVIGTSVGIAASVHDDARRGVIVAPTPTSVLQPLPAPTTANGAQVIFTSESEGWVCGDPILHTADGGAHWQAQSYTDLAAGTHTCAAVPTDAWIFVQSPTGAITLLPAQGGAHIAVTVDFPQVPAGATVAQADFVDRDHGWVLVRPANSEPAHGLLYRTTTATGPMRFELVSSAAPIGRVEFVSATEGWGTDGGSIEHTTDGGATWTAVAIPSAKALGHNWSYDRLGVHGQSVVVAGVDADLSGTRARPFFLVSSDAGATWTVRVGPTVGADVTAASDFEAIDPNTWRLLFGGRLWATADGGVSWHESTPPLPPNTVSISFPSTESNWLLDATGAVYRWTDAGPRREKIDTTPQLSWQSKLVALPGESSGCPVVTVATGESVRSLGAQTTAVAAAREFARAMCGWTDTQVDAVYPVSQSGGEFGGVFKFNVPRQCGAAVANASWGVELGNPSVSQDNSRMTALVVAPVAGGWKVWGFYR